MTSFDEVFLICTFTLIMCSLNMTKKNISSDAFDTEQLLCAMEKLKHGQAVDISKYDFKSYKNNVFPARRVS